MRNLSEYNCTVNHPFLPKRDRMQITDRRIEIYTSIRGLLHPCSPSEVSTILSWRI